MAVHEHWRYSVGTYRSPFYWPDEQAAIWHGFDHYREPADGDVITVHRPDGTTYELARSSWQPPTTLEPSSCVVDGCGWGEPDADGSWTKPMCGQGSWRHECRLNWASTDPEDREPYSVYLARAKSD
jgi:hypothetical protein